MTNLSFLLLFLLHQAASSAFAAEGRGLGWEALCRSAFAPIGVGGALAVYYVSLSGLYALYLALLRRPTQGRGMHSPWILGGATILLLVFTPPSRSTDIYAYLAHGHNGAPNLSFAHAKEIYPDPSTPYLDELGARTGLVGHGPTPYGPLWTHFEVLVYRAAGENIYVGGLLLKAAAAIALLVSAGLGAAIAGPGAGLAILLNPFLLTELVAEGHNDAWMLGLCLLALFFTQRGRHSAAVGAAAGAVLTKYVPALLLAPFLRYLAANRRPWALAVGIGFLFSALAALLLYYPLWLGTGTFQGVRENADAYPAFVRLILKDTFKAYPLAEWIFRAGLWAIFFSFCAGAASRAKNFPHLVLSSALVLLAYLLFFPPFVWPWYLAAPVSFLFLLPQERYRPWALLFCVNASLVAPVWSLHKNGHLSQASASYLEHGLVPGCTIFLFLSLVATSFRVPPEGR